MGACSVPHLRLNIQDVHFKRRRAQLGPEAACFIREQSWSEADQHRQILPSDKRRQQARERSKPEEDAESRAERLSPLSTPLCFDRLRAKSCQKPALDRGISN